MAKQGSIDVHPDRAKIEGLLLAGVQLKQIAQEVPGANVFALSRYKKKFFHSQPETDGDPREEVRKWLSRADDQYLMAVANADQRAAVQSLVAGLRAVESRFKVEERQEAETAKKAESQGVPPISIAQLDQLVRVHNRMETDETRLIESVGRYLDFQMKYYGGPALNLILQFLRDTLQQPAQCTFSHHNTCGELIADFAAFVERRIKGGNRCDIPRPRKVA